MTLFLQQLYWREPLWLLLALLPLVLMLWRLLQQRYSLHRYADTALLPWIIAADIQKRKRWLTASQFLIWLLLAMAAAGPRLLLSAAQDLQPPQGAAVIVIDHSRSMLASDIFPSRLQQAHDVVTRWAGEKDKLKLGLVIFAGASHIVLPVTADKAFLQETASLLNKIQLPSYGSAIVQSLLQAKSLLTKETGSRAIIMLTDGDVAAEKFQQLAQISRQLQKENITLHLLGVGSPSPVALADSAGHWLQYEGTTVVTRVKETELQKLAETPGTFYTRLNPSVHNRLIKVWQNTAARLSAQHYNEAMWHELFPWLLIPALLLIMFNHLSIPRQLSASMTIFILVWLIPPQPVHARAQVDEAEILHQAYSHWQKRDYATAAQYYARVNGYHARMGEGASCFQDKQLDCAITAFSRAAWQAETERQRGRAAFNLGNSFFSQGDFKSAITLFKDALRYQPQQASYQNNLDFSEEVQRNIERRRQQQADSQHSAQHSADSKQGELDNERVSAMTIILTDKTENTIPEKSRFPELGAEQLAYYMQRSQNFAQLSNTQIQHQQRQHDWSRFSNKNPMAAHKVEYWQRLFELEEGMPAHPESPKILPGVAPW